MSVGIPYGLKSLNNQEASLDDELSPFPKQIPGYELLQIESHAGEDAGQSLSFSNSIPLDENVIFSGSPNSYRFWQCNKYIRTPLRSTICRLDECFSVRSLRHCR
jgi:hypothetical protein